MTLSQAGSSVIAQLLGAGEGGRVAKMVGAYFSFAAVIGLVVACLFILLSGLSAQLMGLRGDMYVISSDYLFCLGFGVQFLAMRYAVASVLAARGKTFWNMISTIVMMISNIVFNTLFVTGAFGLPEMGVRGVAYGSCLAWLLSLVFSLVILVWREKLIPDFKMQFSEFREQLRPVLRIALPSVLEPLSWHFTQLIIVAIVVGLGELALATRIYTFNCLYFIVMFSVALSTGVQLKVAHFIGAGLFEKAHKQLLQGLKIGCYSVMGMIALLYFNAEHVIGVFTDNVEIIDLGRKVIAIALFCETGRILNLVAGACLKASGDAKFISIVGFSIMWFFTLPLAWLLGVTFEYGLIGIWVAISSDEIVRGVISVLRWNSGQWKFKGLHAMRAQA